jgi:hypothetical protein
MSYSLDKIIGVENRTRTIQKFIKKFKGDLILDADALRPNLIKNIY